MRLLVYRVSLPGALPTMILQNLKQPYQVGSVCCPPYDCTIQPLASVTSWVSTRTEVVLTLVQDKRPPNNAPLTSQRNLLGPEIYQTVADIPKITGVTQCIVKPTVRIPIGVEVTSSL